MLFAALHESGPGTKRRKHGVELTSAFGGAAELHCRMVSAAFEAYDPISDIGCALRQWF
jgi:hypothetical protein